MTLNYKKLVLWTMVIILIGWLDLISFKVSRGSKILLYLELIIIYRLSFFYIISDLTFFCWGILLDFFYLTPYGFHPLILIIANFITKTFRSKIRLNLEFSDSLAFSVYMLVINIFWIIYKKTYEWEIIKILMLRYCWIVMIYISLKFILTKITRNK